MHPSLRRCFHATATASARQRGPVGELPAFHISKLKPVQNAYTGAEIDRILEFQKYLHYMRLEAFQFEELAEFKTKFRPPTSEEFIRIRHENYVVEQSHGQYRSLAQFEAKNLPLSSPAAIHKFKLIAGPYWNAITDIVTIPCYKFPTREMNDKWISDKIEEMIAAAEDQTDSMADIPLDIRPSKKQFANKIRNRVTEADFPKKWLPPRHLWGEEK